jgi:hypothetical protein
MAAPEASPSVVEKSAALSEVTTIIQPAASSASFESWQPSLRAAIADADFAFFYRDPIQPLTAFLVG